MSASTGPAAAAREASFRGVYAATYLDLLRFVRRRVHPSHAEDVAAEVYLVAWRRFEDRPDGDDATRAWLFGVARHILLNNQRGARRRQALEVRIAAAASVTTPLAQASEGSDAELVALRVDLTAAWPRLSATDREALALAVWDGLSTNQAAAVLQISAVAFRLRLSRARRVLRRHLGVLDENRARSTRPIATILSEGDTP